MNKTDYTIDAAGKKLGRVAQEAATYLMGKDKTDFVRRMAPKVTVKVVNAGRLSISIKKQDAKKYAHFSGYQGGLRFETLAALIERKGAKAALEHAVKGMLPKNKLRPEMLKRLHITD